MKGNNRLFNQRHGSDRFLEVKERIEGGKVGTRTERRENEAEGTSEGSRKVQVAGHWHRAQETDYPPRSWLLSERQA